MTSKTYDNQNTSWRQRVCHDVKNASNAKTFAMASKRWPWRQKHVIMSKTRYDVKRCVMTSKMSQMFRNKGKKPVTVSKGMSKIRHNLKKVRHDIKKMLWHERVRFNIRNTFSLYFVPKIRKHYVRTTKI